MRLVIKAESAKAARKYAEERGFEIKSEVRQNPVFETEFSVAVSGSFTAAANWFCENTSEAPFPMGTLLFYTD